MLGKVIKFIKANKFFLVGLILTLILTWPLFKSGYFTHHDDVQVIRLHQMHACIKDFQIPCRWVPDLGGLYGYPLFNYYGPLPYYFGEIIYLLTTSLIGTAKIMFGFSFVGSYIFMYLLGKKIWGSQLGGAISGIFYAYAPYHAVDFYVRGAMGEMWALTFVPAIFWATYSFFESAKLKYFLLNALFIALLVTSHNLSLMMFLPLIIVFGIVLSLKNKNTTPLAYFIISIIFGLLLSAFYVVPAYLEKGLVHVDTTTMGYFSYTEHFKGLRKLFIERMWGWGASVREIPGGEKDGMSFQIGWIHLAAVAFSVLGLILSYKKPIFKKYFWLILFFLATFGLGVFMVHPRSVFIWNLVKPLKYLQFPWRFLMMIIFSLSVIVGGITVWFKNKWFKYFLAVVFIGGVVGFNFSYFRPEKFLAITQGELLTGALWDKQIKRSIFDYLPIYAKAPPAELADFKYSLEGGGKITDFEKGSNWFSFKAEITSSSNITLAQYYFPNWVVRANGEKLSLNYENNLGLITFVLEPGEYEVKGRLNNTVLRTVSNLLTAFSGLLFLYLWFGKYQNNKVTDLKRILIEK